MKKRLVFVLMMLLGALSTSQADEVDGDKNIPTPTVSLLTCGPTDEYVFYLYGHTAIRVQAQGEDLVYNYGYFSPDQKHFILNFIMGKPMYSVGTTSFDEFIYEYQSQGRSVEEQVLYLLPDEANALVAYLKWNVLPENRDYQYNFYFDNCATRPRDLIEEYTGGLEYRILADQLPTFREAIRNKSHTASWYTTGADCCLGWQTDKKMTLRDAAFLPDLLYQELDQAYRVKDGAKLVIEKKVWLPQTKIIGEGKWSTFNYPFWVFIFVGILYFVLYLVKLFKNHQAPLNFLRTIIYIALSIGGVIIWFLALLSEHPHTFPNANMLLLHPFYLLLLFTMRKVRYNKLNNWLYFSNFVAILIFLGLGYKQTLPIGLPFLAISVAIDQFLHWRETQKKILVDK